MNIETVKEFLKYEVITLDNYSLSIGRIFTLVLIILGTKLLLRVTKTILFNRYKHKAHKQGNVYALFQLIKYVTWVIAIAIILETSGVRLTILLASSAALFVGIGLGLQQTFNDIISGIILLSERSTRVGDILEVDGDIIRVKEIGLRTSKGMNRSDITFIIPNSMITTNKVINWSHQNPRTRFKINVGVAYGSDVDLVTKLLSESAYEHIEVIPKTLINVRLVDFGASSLDFELLFYCDNIFWIEEVKSEIRKNISKKFNENNVKIPFPQMDVHLDPNAPQNNT